MKLRARHLGLQTPGPGGILAGALGEAGEKEPLSLLLSTLP